MKMGVHMQVHNKTLIFNRIHYNEQYNYNY